MAEQHARRDVWHPAVRARVESICQRTVEAAAVDGGGVSLVTPAGHRGTVCATDDRAAQIEEWQFTFGEGPCVDASNWRSPVLVADLIDPREGVAPRWPAFLFHADKAGVRAAFAFPLRIGAISLGVMDLYRLEPGPLEGEQLTSSLLGADAAALALLDLNLDLHDSSGDPDVLDDGPSRASHRLVVHAAAGMMTVQMGVPIEHALLRLRAAAFAQGRSINDVAADVVNRRVRFSPEES